MRRSRAVLALAVLLLGGGISGCASAPEAQPPSPSAPSAAPTPSATASPSPTVTEAAPVLRPTLPHGGDCARVLSASQLDGLLGNGWMAYADKYREWHPDEAEQPVLSSLGTLGGLECRWVAGEGGPFPEVHDLRIVLLPAEQAPQTFAADFAVARCDSSYDARPCRLAGTEGDLWIMARAGYEFEAPPVAFLEQAIAAAAASAEAPLAARAADRRPEWWDLPDCEALGADMGLAELIGEDYRYGYWEGSLPPEEALLAEAGVQGTCPWFTGDTRPPDGEFYIVDLTVAAGAAWQWEQMEDAEASVPVRVAGAESAIAVERDGRANDVVYATDGVNVIAARGADSEFLLRLAERALAALAGER